MNRCDFCEEYDPFEKTCTIYKNMRSYYCEKAINKYMSYLKTKEKNKNSKTLNKNVTIKKRK